MPHADDADEPLQYLPSSYRVPTAFAAVPCHFAPSTISQKCYDRTRGVLFSAHTLLSRSDVPASALRSHSTHFVT